MATGRSRNELKTIEEERANARVRAPRIRDDLTRQSLLHEEHRKRLEQRMLQKASRKEAAPTNSAYGFGRIEVLPNLPEQEKAHNILTQLANDPGVLTCMKKHK